MARAEMTAAQVRALLARVGTEPFDEYVGGVAGLSLRARARTVAWVLRGRVAGSATVRTWTVGDGVAVPVGTARARAGVALDMARRGEDPSSWLGQQSGKAASKASAPVSAPQEPRAWGWEHAVERYLALNEPTWRAATHSSHRRNLNHPDVAAALGGKTLRQVSADDIARLQNGFADRGKRAMARAVAVSVGGLLRWAATRPESGLSKAAAREAVDVEPVKVLAPAADGRVPTPEVMGAAPWLLGAPGVKPRMRFAVLLLALTAQRVRTVREAEHAHVAGGTWRVPAALMKSGRPHVLPLPPLATACFEALRKLAGDSKWAFPQSDGTGPTTYRPFREAVSGVLSGHGPHALRRAFATHGEGVLRLPLDRISLVLDHEEGGVTRRHYALHERHEFTAEALAAWERWLVQQMLACRPAGAPEWPGWLPRPADYQ